MINSVNKWPFSLIIRPCLREVLADKCVTWSVNSTSHGSLYKALWTVLIFSHPSVFLFSLLSEWIILSSYSLVQINGDLHMGSHKPPRSSSSLCHCHGDSTERSRYMAGLVRDTQCFLVLPQAHMGTYTDSPSIKEMKEIDSSFPLTAELTAPFPFTQFLIHIFTVTHTSSWLSERPSSTDSFRFPQCLMGNRFFDKFTQWQWGPVGNRGPRWLHTYRKLRKGIWTISECGKTLGRLLV